MHDYLILNWRKIAMFLGENETKYEIRGYTHNEIKRMLDVTNIKYKAIILLLASTGMRRDALVRLELKDMEYLNDYNLFKIKIYKKSEYEQICFTTPEAADAIKLYLKASMRNGAKYFHNVGNKAISMALSNLAAKPGIIAAFCLCLCCCLLFNLRRTFWPFLLYLFVV
jgi:integrase